MRGDWKVIRKKLLEVMTRASQLDPDKVYWKGDNADQPPPPSIDLSLSAPTNPGQDAVVNGGYDGSRPAGHEIKLVVDGQREAMLTIECFTAQIASTAETGDDAMAIVDALRTRLVFPSYRDDLYSVGVSLPDTEGPIEYLPALIAAKFRGRAVLAMPIWMPAQALTDFIGYIGTARITGQVHGGKIDPEPIDLTVGS